MKRGIGIIHYDRLNKLREVVEAVIKTAPKDCKIVVADDGTKGDVSAELPKGVILIRGDNLGVAHNKNRALWALQDCEYIALLEDDLKPVEQGWFSDYENAARQTGTHHFCRVQNKEIPDTYPSFTAHLASGGLTPVFGSSPRGDLTFITGRVIRMVGGFNTDFKGVGCAHGEFSDRVFKAGLIPHPLRWLDIKEARDKIIQIGDTEGGRWKRPRAEIRKQIRANEEVRKRLNEIDYIFFPLSLS